MDEDDDDVPTCPLCLEELDATDRAVKACQCGYQVCLWCLHTIRERLNRRCPACRTLYEEHNFKIDDVNPEQAAKEAIERQTAKKERERREKLKEFERERARAIVLSQQKAKSNLKHARILQRNLVYVIGLSLTLAREEVIRRTDMFAKFGKMMRILVNRSHPFNADAPGGPSISAYVQYQRDADALAAVRAMNNAVFDGREIRCAIATTKYCDTYVRNVQTGDPSCTFHCGNANCMYYHTTSHADNVLTREEVLARQLGPPPPAHLFLPAPHRTTIPPHPRAPSALATSSQPGSHAGTRPSANRPQINSIPLSQPHSSAPIIHPLSGPSHPPNSFSVNSSSALPVSTTSAACLSSFSPEATSPSTPSAPPGTAITPSHSQWSPPLSPHADSRPILKTNRSPSREDRSAPHSPAVALSSSLPSTSSFPLSSAAWASTQPGHPISRSPTRRPSLPLGDEEPRPRLQLGARRQSDAPPGFEGSSMRSASENPSQPPGFDAPPPSRILSDDVPASSASAERSKTSPIMVPKAASAAPASLSLGSPRPDATLSPTSPPGASIAPPPGFGPGPALKAEPVDDTRQNIAAAWSQEASADKVFSANDRRPVAPVKEVGAHLSPTLSQEMDRSRAGLEKVLANIGGSLGVSSEFQAVPPVQSPRYVPPAVSAAVESVPVQYVDTAAQNDVHLPPDDHVVPRTLPSFIPNRDGASRTQQSRYTADVHSNAAASYTGRGVYQQTGTVLDPVLRSPTHSSNSYFATTSGEASQSLSVSDRRSRSRFSFAQDQYREVDTSVQARGVHEILKEYELPGSGVRPNDGSDTLAMKKVPELMVAKKQSLPPSRQARSRFDFADHGSSPPRSANVEQRVEGDLALRHEMRSGVAISAKTAASSASLPQVAQAPHPPVLGESFHQLSTEEKLASIFTSAKWSSEALPPMPQYDPKIEEVMQQVASPLAATAPVTGVGLGGSMASAGTVPISMIEGHASMRRMRNTMGLGVGGGAPDVVGGGGLPASHFDGGSIGLPPPGFREATPGIVPDTTADEKTSATTGVASMVVSGGGVSNHQGETGTSNVTVGLEEAISSGTESFEDDRRRSRAQRKRDRKARQLREVAERKFAKTEGRARSRGSAPQQATHGGGGGDLLGAEDNVVEQVTKATAAVVNVHTTGKPAGVGPSGGSTEKQLLTRPLHTSSSRNTGDERQTETAQVGGKERESEKRKQEGSSTNCGGEGVSVSNNCVNVESHGLTIATGSGVTAFPKDGEGTSVNKLSEDGGKYMSVSELEREVEAARVREAQLQDKLMEITRRLRSYDNVRT